MTIVRSEVRTTSYCDTVGIASTVQYVQSTQIISECHESHSDGWTGFCPPIQTRERKEVGRNRYEYSPARLRARFISSTNFASTVFPSLTARKDRPIWTVGEGGGRCKSRSDGALSEADRLGLALEGQWLLATVSGLDFLIILVRASRDLINIVCIESS